MRFFYVAIALFACFVQAIGQTHIPDATLDIDFESQVKSIDEFISRFNGEESKPGLRSDSLRRDNIISLFDFKMSHENMTDVAFKQQIADFTKAALNWKNRLSISEGTIAEAKCLVKYSGKEYVISLFLKRDSTIKGNNKWGITGIRGVEALKLFGKNRVTISPVDHETHFMSLQDFFQSNKNLIPSLRSNDKEIDQLSFFFGLCVAKVINFIRVNELKFHFLNLPQYNFVVEEIGRTGTNSGWLITHLYKTPLKEDKKKYLNQLLGVN